MALPNLRFLNLLLLIDQNKLLNLSEKLQSIENPEHESSYIALQIFIEYKTFDNKCSIDREF